MIAAHRFGHFVFGIVSAFAIVAGLPSARAQAPSYPSATVTTRVSLSNSADVRRASPCFLLVEVGASPQANCRVTVSCGRGAALVTPVYGGSGSTFRICAVDPASGSVSIYDSSYSDGDPALMMSAVRGMPVTVRVWNATWHFDLAGGSNSSDSISDLFGRAPPTAGAPSELGALLGDEANRVGTYGSGNGLGTVAPGGGAGGTSYAHGGGGLGDRGPPAPVARPATDEVPATEGGLDADQIRRVVNRNITQVQHCYEQGLQRNPSLSGRVTIAFVIAPNGSVTQSSVADDRTGDARVAQCVADVVLRWAFPSPTPSGSVRVRFPFNLSQDGR